MVSQFTWPNFRSGTDRDGVKVLLDENHFTDDVKYGKTKIFIRSPRTLFALETARNNLIPGIVTLIQKTWRGYVARQQYKRMRALLTMVRAYRLKKMRTYINLLERKFMNAKRMPDYGKSIQWPEPPKALRRTADIFHRFYDRWRAFKILSRIPRNEWPQMKLKITAASALINKRSDYGLNRKWDGNYLAMLNENNNYTMFNDAVNNLKNLKQFNTVIFSSYITKFNKFNKTAERIMLVTDRYIFKLDCEKFRNMKEGISLASLTGISATPGRDQLIILHSPDGNDLVVSLHFQKQEDRIGELIGTICAKYYE